MFAYFPDFDLSFHLDMLHRLDPEAGEDAMLPVSVQEAMLDRRAGPKVNI